MADDLASLPLDVLMNESGWRRAFPNPFLAPGIA
jgi:formate dehydrogenase maturation protein FdhE